MSLPFTTYTYPYNFESMNNSFTIEWTTAPDTTFHLLAAPFSSKWQLPFILLSLSPRIRLTMKESFMVQLCIGPQNQMHLYKWLKHRRYQIEVVIRQINRVYRNQRGWRTHKHTPSHSKVTTSTLAHTNMTILSLRTHTPPLFAAVCGKGNEARVWFQY